MMIIDHEYTYPLTMGALHNYVHQYVHIYSIIYIFSQLLPDDAFGGLDAIKA